MVDKYAPQAIWGRELRHYRQEAGLTQAQLAEQIHWSEATISMIETGQSPAAADFAAACDEIFKTGGALLRLLDWRKGERFPAWFGKWRDTEQEAKILRTYQPLLVPGLLQTEAYARAVLGGDEEAVAARMERQEILTRKNPPSPRLWCVLDEGVLHRPVGGREVMREQLEYLIACASPKISIQIIPHGAYDGLIGGLVIATLPEGRKVAYVDTIVRDLTTSEPDDVAKAEERFEVLRTEALPSRMSMDLIRSVVEERWT